MSENKGLTIDQLCEEITEYLNENNYGVKYDYLGCSETDAETGITELYYRVQNINKMDNIIIEHTFPQEGSPTGHLRGHVFHLKLKAPSTKLDASVNKWIAGDTNRAETDLNAGKKSRRKK